MRLDQKNAWVASIRSNHPASLLFWKEELKEIHALLTGGLGEVDLQRTCVKLLRLNPSAVDATLRETILNSVNASRRESSSWFVMASVFLQSVYEELGARRTESSKREGKITLHSVSGNGIYGNEAVLGVLQHIYQVYMRHCFFVVKSKMSTQRAFPVYRIACHRILRSWMLWHLVRNQN